jgi:phospholipase C
MRLASMAMLALVLIFSGCRGITGFTSSGSTTTNAGSLGSINHILFMVQENRSFDHYFGQLGAYRAKVGVGSATDIDGIPADASNPALDSGYIHSYHLATTCVEELSPDWLESHVAMNRDHPGWSPDLMNGFVTNAAKYAQANNEVDTAGARGMGYYDDSDLPYYYFMATQFATSDRWFSPIPTESIPNRIFLQAATTAGHVHEPDTTNGACCDNIRTIYHALEDKGISWKIYYSDTLPNGQPLTDLSNYWPQFATAHADHIVPIAQYFVDLTNHALPAVAFIQAGNGSGRDEHPGGQQQKGEGGNDIQLGARYASEIINELMKSSSWNDSVFILTFDEGGTFYDHVPPMKAVQPDSKQPLDLNEKDQVIQPQGKFDRTGFRLPLMVISPFTKKNYVSHTPADSTAILKLIETRFGLSNLSKRDRAQMDMTEFFDFTGVPWATPPQPPEQTVQGRCSPGNIPQTASPTP